MEPIKIKEVIISDHRAVIAGLMQGLQQSEYERFQKTAPWHEVETSYMRHMILMQDEAEGTCLVAYAEGMAVGFIFGYAEEHDDSRIEVDTGKELYVSDGYVVPEYRKQGIYKRLNHQLEQKYIQQGVRRITRFTLVNNEPMKTFLGRSGYSATRILYEKWL